MLTSAGSTVLGQTLLPTATSSGVSLPETVQGSALPAGTYTITVNYGGDSNYLGSTTTVQLQVLGPSAATTTTLNMPAAASQGRTLRCKRRWRGTDRFLLAQSTSRKETPTWALLRWMQQARPASRSIRSLLEATLSRPSSHLQIVRNTWPPNQAATLIVNLIAADMLLSLSTAALRSPTERNRLQSRSRSPLYRHSPGM
jgi:hypothetical protein